jgi:ribulose-bisphosphate carboxylase large chain
MPENEIEVAYRLRTPEADLEMRTEALLLEQTVELPRLALHSAYVRERFVGRVINTEESGDDTFLVRLGQPWDAIAGDPAQLLNVLFGNCSLQDDVELVDVKAPPALARMLGGPRFGIDGWRALCGVRGRALASAALKPVGLSIEEIGELCRTLALAGMDVIKDDHGLADHPRCPFAERVRACLAATAEAAQATGRRALYVPNLIGSPETVRRQAGQAAELGAGAVMVSPMLVGLPFFAELVRELGRPILAHPAFGGAQRIDPVALIGKLFPLFGADGVIFPNAGGRFSYSARVCADIARAARAPEPPLRPSLPVPAGGIKVENAAAVLKAFGPDSMVLVGASLLAAPDLASLLERGRQLVAAVHDSSPS